MPKQVPRDAPGQYFSIEQYYLTEPQRSAIKQKHIHTILKLNCYRALLLGEEPEVNPSPEEIAAKMLRQYVCILATVAIPAYTGYITKANEAADYTTCDAVKTAAVAAHTDAQARAGSDVTAVTSISVSAGAPATSVTINGSATATDISAYYAQTIAFKSGVTSAAWNGTTWTLNS